jgi:hypothetical protein
MPGRLPPVYCDEDVSVVLAAMLRARGFVIHDGSELETTGAIRRGATHVRDIER